MILNLSFNSSLHHPQHFQTKQANIKIHDWNISRSIVQNVKTPVILAGGLSIENVQEAIAKVQPWGVDSLTHTNKLMDDGSFVKDFKKVEEFVKKSKEII